MGIEQRRARERERRRQEILSSAWVVADALGWGSFSVEKVAKEAELGRATIYSYFASLDELVVEMARQALGELSDRIAAAASLVESLDVPVRFAQRSPARFGLLFPPTVDNRSHMTSEALTAVRAEARRLLGTVQRLAESSGSSLPADSRSAAAFLAGISLAGAVVPELRSSTPLRRKWQNFCLSEGNSGDGDDGEGGAPSGT